MSLYLKIVVVLLKWKIVNLLILSCFCWTSLCVEVCIIYLMSLFD